mmetsp:Transcript_7785/g.17950  ORF Transcript_7785/g.17950 Transcript_7785/m.17950 type:complete len:378 (-) Transcript_7785:555-1688(-)
MRWLPVLVLLLSRWVCAEVVSDDAQSCFLQTERHITVREDNETVPEVLYARPEDVLKYAAPRPQLREEAAATKELSTGTMVGIGAALLVIMIGLNLVLGRAGEQDAPKDIAQDDKAPQAWRRFTAVMLLSMFLLNYADRYNISVAIIEISEERGYGFKTQGIVQSAVYMGLIPGAVFAGKLASPDFLGPHWALVVGCAFWSLSTLLTPICGDQSLGWLVFIRICLGFGEAAASPSLYQLASTWFPKYQQPSTLAMGVAGQCLGAAVAMSFAGVTEKDWRIMFYVFGSAGMLWCFAFGMYGAATPDRHRYISKEELAAIKEVKRHEPVAGQPLPYLELLRHGAVRGLLTAEFCSSFTWFFLALLDARVLPRQLRHVDG